MNFEFWILNYKLSIVNYQLSTINYQLLTVNCQLFTASLRGSPIWGRRIFVYQRKDCKTLCPNNF